MTCDGKDIDARRGRYRPKEEGVSYEKVERILSEKGGEIVRKKRGNCTKKEGISYKKWRGYPVMLSQGRIVTGLKERWMT